MPTYTTKMTTPPPKRVTSDWPSKAAFFHPFIHAIEAPRSPDK